MGRFLFLLFSLLVQADECMEGGDSPYALTQLNALRKEAHLTPLLTHPLLNRSAYNHAYYLCINHVGGGHGELATLPHFSGAMPKDRVHAVGYHAYGGEYLTGGVRDADEALENLLSAIYHRLGLLAYDVDEVGVGSVGGHYVFNMGRQELNTLCQENNATEGGTHYLGICIDPQQRIDGPLYLHASDAIKHSNPEAIVWPYAGMEDFSPAFFQESPDPLPDYDVSGNPISIEFNTAKVQSVTLLSLTLYQGERPITRVRLLDALSDPNHKLTPLQFALFPLERLQWDQRYRVVGEFIVNHEPKTYQWSFKTRTFPRLQTLSETTATVAIRPATTYALYIPPTHPRDVMHSYSVSLTSGVVRNTLRLLDGNTFEVNLSGDEGKKATLILPSGRKIVLILSTTAP